MSPVSPQLPREYSVKYLGISRGGEMGILSRRREIPRVTFTQRANPDWSQVSKKPVYRLDEGGMDNELDV